MAKSVIDLLSDRIEEQINLLVNSLSDGVAKDYAEYRDMCGAIRGLRTAHRETNDLVRKIKEDEDD
jgi:hypothetical protein